MNRDCATFFTYVGTIEYNHVLESAPEMIAYQNSHGRLTDVLLDDLGIVKLPPDEHNSRDNKSIQQRPPELLTHDETLEREIAFARRGGEQAAIKKVDNAKKLLVGIQKKKDVKAAAEVARVAERTRKANLSVEDARQEAALKKALIQKKKDDKELIAKAKENGALLLVSNFNIDTL